jgi:hypothetical protein
VQVNAAEYSIYTLEHHSILVSLDKFVVKQYIPNLVQQFLSAMYQDVSLVARL